METRFNGLPRLLLCLALLAASAGIAPAQFFRSSVCNCPMCQAIRAGTWQGSYAATFRRASTPALTGAHAPTPLSTVDTMLRAARLTPDDLLYDPGCGDGRIVESAVRDYGCRAVGIEIQPTIAAQARQRLHQSLPQGRWRIHTGDSRKLDLGQATAAVMYLYPHDLKQIVPRLRNATRLVSYRHPIPGYPNRTIQDPQGVVYVVDRTADADVHVTVTWKPWRTQTSRDAKPGVEWRAWRPAPHTTSVPVTESTRRPAPRTYVIPQIRQQAACST